MGRRIQRDEIGFHNLLYQMREERAVSRNMLRHGLFSDSEMHYIESGERLPDYLTRNRLMARLGVSAEGYEDFLQPSEYDRYLQGLELMKAVEQRETGSAKELLDCMLKTCNEKDKIERQFLLDMKGRIARQEGRPALEIRKIYEEAIVLTLPDFSLEHMERYVLSPEEYYYLLSMLKAKEESVCTMDVLEYVLQHIHSSEMEGITLSKILPRAAVQYAESVIKAEKNERFLDAYDYLTDALSILRKHHRLYYLSEVLELRSQLLEKQLAYPNKKEELEENARWKEALTWIYELFPTEKTMEDDCYIYRGAEIYCVADVIRERRKMLGLSQSQLADGLCATRTLMRIENKQTDSQWGIVKDLFNRLGISGVYRRTEFLANSHKAAAMYEKYRYLNNNRRYDEAEKAYEEIKSNIDESYLQNRQSIKRMQLRKALREKTITPQEFCEKAWACLGESHIKKENAYATNGYLTIVERALLYSIAITCKEDSNYQLYMKQRRTVVTTTNEFPQYELGMTWCVSELGNRGKYKESNEQTRKLIQLCISAGRGTQMAANLFNIIWNDAMQDENKSNPTYLSKMKNIKTCASLMNNLYIKEFIEGRILLFKDGKDWTN